MKTLITLIILATFVSCASKSTHPIAEHLDYEISFFPKEDKKIATAMPRIKKNSSLKPFARRLDFLLVNQPALFQPNNDYTLKLFDSLGALYPDTIAVQQAFQNEFLNDSALMFNLDIALAGIQNKLKTKEVFSEAELMKVASRFFYCDKVRADSSIQTHVCIGIHGINEANFDKDYAQLAAFCYEAIFDNFRQKNGSVINQTYAEEKALIVDKHRLNITSLDEYLEVVKQDLFVAMEQSDSLKSELLAYYDLQKESLPFIIEG